MTGDVRRLFSFTESLFWHNYIAKPPLWVVLHVQSQAREECESDSVCIVVVWAGGHFFPFCIALHQARSSRYAAKAKMPVWSWLFMPVLVSGAAMLYSPLPARSPNQLEQLCSPISGTWSPTSMAWVGLSHMSTLWQRDSSLGINLQKGGWDQVAYHQ